MRPRQTDQFFSLSEDVVLQLKESLRSFFDDNDRLLICIEALDGAKRSFQSLEGYADARLLRQTYANAAQDIITLQKTLDKFGVAEIETLSDLIEGFESNENLASFDSDMSDPKYSGIYGTTFSQTREQLTILLHALEHAVNQINVPRGAKPKLDHRNLAWFVARELEGYLGIKLTTYDDGLYFRALSIMLRDSFGDVGEDAHRRPGAWSLREGKVDDDGVAFKHLPFGRISTE